jgi:hypothetical protein
MGSDDELAFKYFHDNLSLTLLAIVNARYEFWWVSDIYAGATHDSRIWRASNLASLVGEGVFPPNDTAVSLLCQLIQFFILFPTVYAPRHCSFVGEQQVADVAIVSHELGNARR